MPSLPRLHHHISVPAAALIVLASLAACTSGSSSGSGHSPGTAADVAATTVRITGAGSTFDAPFFDLAFSRYQQAHPDVAVSYASVGSSAGITRYAAAKTDFGATDVPASAKDLTGASDGSTVQVTVDLGAVDVAYNVPVLNGQPLKLTGELSQAAALLMEGERIDPGIRAAILPYVPLLLAAWRGDETAAAGLTEVMVRGASTRGEGAALTSSEYARAVLCNGVGKYGLAAEAAHSASTVDELVISPWALYELAEAAVRSDQRERAAAAANRLSEIAAASASDWARGAAARSKALLAEGSAAEDLYREAVELLSRTRMAAHLARARLSYGEWLRRENRRVDARDQLRVAYEMLTSMGAEGFAERACRELQAIGQVVRRQTAETRDELTAQETQIARLAGDGHTNPEIGAELFLSARTVEWHLRKVYPKLGISSRRQLHEALTDAGGRASAGGA
jgi:DNA-binding CsgD family transcriptional regulator